MELDVVKCRFTYKPEWDEHLIGKNKGKSM